MNDPCEKCRERDICQKDETIDECARKKTYRLYKIKCREISEKTKEIMAAAKEKVES